MTEPWNPDMDRLKNELEQAKARISEVEAERDRAILNAGKCIADDRETIETLKSRVGEANRTGQVMGAAIERERIAAWLEALDADGGIAEASEMQPYLHGRVRNVAHLNANPYDQEPDGHVGAPALPEGARTEMDDGVEWVVLTGPRPPDNRWVRASTVSPSVAFVRNRDGQTNPVTRRVAEAVLAVLSKETTPAPEPAGLSDPEPAPTGDGEPIWPLVIADMEERNREGVRKYGTPLRAHNGRKALVDLYQELLDATVYLRQYIEEGTPGSTEP